MDKPNVFGFVILLVCINVLLFVNGVRVVDGDTSNFLNKFVSVEGNSISISDNLSGAVPSTLQDGGSGDFLGFIDAIKTVSSFILLIVNIVFTPIGLFTGGGLPVEIGLIMGVPLILIGVMSIVYFVRSGT